MKRNIYFTLVLLFATLQTFAQTTNTYEYDANNRLVKVTYARGITVTYTYDELGNRLSKTVEVPNPKEDEAYAMLSEDGKTLTFCYDKQRDSRATTYDLNSGETAPAWSEKASNITKVVFNSEFSQVRPTTTFSWFNNMSALTTITGIANLNTSSVTNMRSMFSGCAKLTTLNLSRFNTSKVTTMYEMFKGCSALKQLTLVSATNSDGTYTTTFTTTKCATYSGMFANCSSLKELVLASFRKTSNIISKDMFLNCSSLERLYFGLDFTSLENSACTGVGTTEKPCVLECPAFDPSATTRTPKYMIWKKGYFVDGLRKPYVTLSSGVLTFSYGIPPTSGTVYALNEDGVVPDWNAKASSVKSVTIEESFKNARPTSTYSWFRTMGNLTKVTGWENITTTYVTDMSYMFSAATSLESIDVSHFNTKKVTNMEYMFNHCNNLTSLDLSSFTFAEGINTKQMLNEDKKLKSLSVPSTAASLNSNACRSVGTEDDPCALTYPDGFSPYKTSTGYGYYVWKSGYFLSPTLGDVNRDKVINVTDAMCIVDYTLGRPLNKFYYINANLNNDQAVDVTDAMIIVDIILGRSTSKAPETAKRSFEDEMFLTTEGSDLTLHLRDGEPFTAGEMLVTLPQGCRLYSVVMDEGSSNVHNVLLGDLGNGLYRIVVMSPNGQELSHANTALLHLSVRGKQGGEVKVSEIQMTNSAHETVVLNDITATVTDIIDVNADATEDGDWYNVQGMKVKNPGQQRGVYIRNGKKYTITH